MGEIKKKLAEVELSTGERVDFELNISPDGKGEDHIHVQGRKLRIELSRSEFTELSTAILRAASKLKRVKKIEDKK